MQTGSPQQTAAATFTIDGGMWEGLQLRLAISKLHAGACVKIGGPYLQTLAGFDPSQEFDKVFQFVSTGDGRLLPHPSFP